MRLIKRVGAAIAAAGGIFGLVALAGPGTASADTVHCPGLIGDVSVIAPVDVRVVDNTIAVLGVIDD